jgi:ribosomal protein S18 acetylase RimI-like enzyme
METIRQIQQNEELPMDLLLLADPNEQIIQSYLPRSKCFVLELKGMVVGIYLLLPTRPLTIELVNIAVDESMQGKGFGKKLVIHAIETARILGYKTIEVGTGNSSLGQIGLYQKCGFRITGIDIDFFVKHYCDPIMENGIQCRDMIRLQQEL